jgi:hypothetical protein
MVKTSLAKDKIFGDINTASRKLLESISSVIMPGRFIRRRVKQMGKGRTGIIKKSHLKEAYEKAFNDELEKIAASQEIKGPPAPAKPPPGTSVKGSSRPRPVFLPGSEVK